MATKALRAAMLLGLAVTLAGPCVAQDPLPLGPGVRVRLSVAASRDRLTGTVQSLDDRLLSVISDDHQLVQVARGSVTRLETGWGRKRNARKGLVIGAATGAGLGVLVCAANSTDVYGTASDSCDGAGEWLGVTLVSAAAYGGIGALIGHFIKSDRWIEMPIAKVQVSLGPSGRGLGLAVGVRF